MASLLCEHWELFSEAWPTSGMMRNGQVFELQMRERHTADIESLSPLQRLPTTRAQHGEDRNNKIYFREANKPQNLENALASVVNLPTPTTRDYKDGQAEHKRDGVVQTDTVSRAVFNSGEVTLIGTPRATASDSSSVQVANGAPKGRIEDQVKLTNWGKFEPAICRWEQTLGITAPAPTKPDGKENAHRLSSEFTEWMMGLEPGWITDCGLTRNEELKAAGNGVVPQQAELALRILLGLDIPKALERERERERELIPTPTVFHVSMHDEPIETFLTRQAKSSTGQIGKSLGVALRMELDK
jgi:hypothetical protein